MSELKNLKKEWQAVMSCMGCGDCGYAIRPAVGRYLTCPVKEAKGEKGFEIYFSRGRMNVLKSILEGKLPLSSDLAEFVYQCSECGNCSEVCHQTHNENIVLNTSKWIDHVKVWDALRRDLVEAGFAPLDRHSALIEYMNKVDMKNPYGEDKAKKFDWAKEFPNIKDTGDIAFFGGCTIPLRQLDTLKNLMNILQAAGKEIAYSKDEWCCGSISLRIGDINVVMETVKHNVDELKKTGAKTVFTACAGCYRTLKLDYPELLGEELPFEVKHITEILADLINNNEIPFKAGEGEKIKITYHDPCHLGRHMDLYEVPREVISKIPGVELVEMKRNRKHAWCCGAGGGVKSQFPDLSKDISKERIKEAVESGAEILTTSCPFCIGNFRDAYEEMEPDIKEKIQVIDLIDYIVSRITDKDVSTEKAEKDIYRKLQEHLHKMPIGYPPTKSGVEIRILKMFYTPEQAKLATKLSYKFEPLQSIYERVKELGMETSIEKLEQTLDDMVANGGLKCKEEDGSKSYATFSLLLGMYDSQVNRASKEFLDAYNQYVDEGFGLEIIGTKIPLIRVVPVEKSLTSDLNVTTYEQIRALVENTDKTISVSDCVCRRAKDTLGNPCKVTSIRENCFGLGFEAEAVIKYGSGRKITKEEALEILQKSQEDGLVLQAGNSQDPEYICCCCGCCCGFLEVLKTFPRPSDFTLTNYYSDVNLDLCIGCGLCVDICQMGALKLVDEKVKIRTKKCIGCGNCVRVCPESAMFLKKRDEVKIPPEDPEDLYRKIEERKLELQSQSKTQKTP